MQDVNVKWSEEPVTSYEDGIMKLLKYYDENQERNGWDQAPQLGVVTASSLADTSALGIESPQFPESFYEDFHVNLAALSMQAFLAETTNSMEYQSFLDDGIRYGFQGWLLSAEFVSVALDDEGNQVGAPLEHRLTMFVDLDGDKYGVARLRGEPKSEPMTDYPVEIIRPLSLLVAASALSIVRRNLDKGSQEE